MFTRITRLAPDVTKILRDQVSILNKNMFKIKHYHPCALEDAIKAVNKGKSVRGSARTFRVPESTLRVDTLPIENQEEVLRF